MSYSYIRLFVGLFMLSTACLFIGPFKTESKSKLDTPFTANDDSIAVHGGTVLHYVDNDDLAGYSPYATIVDAPSHGTISAGSLYVPASGYTGSDSFTYHLCLAECSNLATVTLSITNSAPIMTGDVYEVPYNGVLCINLTKFAYDPENDGFYDVDFISFPTNGWLTGGSCGKTYHANSNFTGVDTFSYKLCDSLGACTGEVTTTVFVTKNWNDSVGTCRPKIPMAPAPPVAPCYEGQPINVMVGNMWLQQTDYQLAGLGESISIQRTYNTWVQAAGLFGKGWTTQYDESLTLLGSTYSNNLVRLNLPDGKGVLLGRASSSDPFKMLRTHVRGALVANTDGTYTFTFRDGRMHHFSSAGKLLWQKDRNGNQTTLTYTSGVLSSVTDPFSRTLTFTTNGSGNVTQIADSTGTVATYDYFTGTNKLKTVTFADSSEYNFEYTTLYNTPFLTTVKDALDNVLESHTYNSSALPTNSEVDGGEEEFTFDYTNTPYGQTEVTDGLGHAKHITSTQSLAWLRWLRRPAAAEAQVLRPPIFTMTKG